MKPTKCSWLYLSAESLHWNPPRRPRYKYSKDTSPPPSGGDVAGTLMYFITDDQESVAYENFKPSHEMFLLHGKAKSVPNPSPCLGKIVFLAMQGPPFTYRWLWGAVMMEIRKENGKCFWTNSKTGGHITQHYKNSQTFNEIHVEYSLLWFCSQQMK